MEENNAVIGIVEFCIGLIIICFFANDLKLVLILSGIHLVLIIASRFFGMTTLKLVLLIIGIELFLG